MKPWYQKKKFVVAILTGIAYAVSTYLDNPKIGDGILYVGLTLIGAIGAEDFGKAKTGLFDSYDGQCKKS